MIFTKVKNKIIYIGTDKCSLPTSRINIKYIFPPRNSKKYVLCKKIHMMATISFTQLMRICFCHHDAFCLSSRMLPSGLSISQLQVKVNDFTSFLSPVYAYTATICILLKTSLLITHIILATRYYLSFPNTAHTTYSELLFPSKKEIPSHTARRNVASKCFLSTEDGRWHRPEASHATNVNHTNSPFGRSC